MNSRTRIFTSAIVGLGWLVCSSPKADACWWMFQKKSQAKAPAPAQAQADLPPAPAPAPAPRPRAGPPPSGPECAIETKIGQPNATVIEAKKRFVEAQYAELEKFEYCPAVLETRFKEVTVPAVKTTCYKQEWVEPVFATVCRREWVAPTFKSVCREARDNEQFVDVTSQKYIPAKVSCKPVTRKVPDGNGGFVSYQDIELVIEKEGRIETFTERKVLLESGNRIVMDTVVDREGYWKEHIETVMVRPGHFRTVEHAHTIKEASTMKVSEIVEVQPARLEKKTVKVLVKPGHWVEVFENGNGGGGGKANGNGAAGHDHKK